MQDCFREYPEIYAAEIADDEEPTFDSPPADEPAGSLAPPKEEAPKAESTEVVAQSPTPVTEVVKDTKAVKEKVVELKEKVEAKSEAFPNKTHDATGANEGKE